MRQMQMVFKTVPNIQEYYPHGYRGYSDVDEKELWDKLLLALDDSKRYVHHIISSKWVKNDAYPVVKYPGFKALFGAGDEPQDIPCGDLIYTIDIYYEKGN